MAAVEHVHEPVGPRRNLRVMRHEDDRQPALGAQLLDEVEHGAAGFGVEAAGRLVREQDRGLVRQRSGDRDALALPTRQLRRPIALPTFEPDGTQKGSSALPPLASGQAELEHRHLDVLDRRQGGQQVVELEDHSDVTGTVVAQLA